MKVIECPKCGLPMRRVAVARTTVNGKNVVIYVCPNKAMCGTVIHIVE